MTHFDTDCERCGGWPEDHCAECYMVLCKSCMERGCCGHYPAISGKERDRGENGQPGERGEA